MRKKLMEVE